MDGGGKLFFCLGGIIDKSSGKCQDIQSACEYAAEIHFTSL